MPSDVFYSAQHDTAAVGHHVARDINHPVKVNGNAPSSSPSRPRTRAQADTAPISASTSVHSAELDNGITDRVCTVTGAGGYFGRRLCAKLLWLGAKHVRMMDLREPPMPEHADPKRHAAHVTRMAGDVTRVEDVERAVKGADVVFHVASYGMSGAQMLDSDMIHRVNVQGTQLIVNACLKSNVQRLVYTSTYNVCFGGESVSRAVCVLAKH